MEKMELRAFWESCATSAKNTVLISVAERCGKSIQTVQAWILGSRNPSRLDHEALCAFIRENFNVEIVTKRGEQ